MKQGYYQEQAVGLELEHCRRNQTRNQVMSSQTGLVLCADPRPLLLVRSIVVGLI